jgi:O-antigen ligase
LPGHGLYARVAEQAGMVVWRPLSLTPDLTLNALFGLLPATAAGLAALLVGARGRWRLAQWLVVAACASGLLGLVQLAAGNDTLHLFNQSSGDSAVGLFANRNHQAAFLACALPLAGAWAGARLGHDHRLGTISAFGGAIAFLLVAIVATGSRMGLMLAMLGLVAAVLCFQASGHSLKPASLPRSIAIAGGLIVLAALVAIVGIQVGIVDRLLDVEPAAEARAGLLEPMIKTAEAFMPWGAGFGAFDSVYRQFEPNSLLSTIYMNHAHNELLELAIEGGIPALLLLAAFLWWWLLGALAVITARPRRNRRPLAIAAVAITAMLIFSSLVDYPLRTPLLSALFLFACVEMMRTRAAFDEPAA